VQDFDADAIALRVKALRLRLSVTARFNRFPKDAVGERDTSAFTQCYIGG
jgi:hypothetical protein